MKKFWAEIIAGVIPDKMLRNQWRGKLRYGLSNIRKLKRAIKEHTEPPQHYLAVCAIAKNEGQYFKEWLDWHIAQGVDKFYIYDNSSEDDTAAVLKPYVDKGIVEYINWPGVAMQLPAYDDCLERHRFDSRWIAFIDLDEFIVPVKYSTLRDFLQDAEQYSAVEINWLIYGSGGAKEHEPGRVMQRFHKHSVGNHILNRHVKSIVDPRRVCNMIGCHEAARIRGNAADSHLRPLKRSFRDREPQQDVIKINHYAVKSYEEFLEKRARGRARGRIRMRELEYFDRFDLNDIED